MLYKIFLLLMVVSLAACTHKRVPYQSNFRTASQKDGYTLIWSDEFDTEGKPDSASWTYEIKLSSC